MMERPILFSGIMVKAILDDRKGQTRRVIKPQPDHCHRDIIGKSEPYNKVDWNRLIPQIGDNEIKCPYGKVGDILWVRETWQLLPSGFDEIPPEEWYIYKATDELSDECTKWRPAIHMPRKACRIRLKTTDIRVERLQDITEEDAKAEGMLPSLPKFPEGRKGYRTSFEFLWNSLNEKRSYGWKVNPWVWVIEFERVRG